MNRTMQFLVAVLALATTVQTEAQFSYVTNHGSITITGYTGSNGVVVIPATITGLPVTSIGNSAFWGQGMTAVTIPDTVTNVGILAFNECHNVTNVALGGGLITIESSAFQNCQSLRMLSIPGSVRSVGNYAFYRCLGLQTLALPESITELAPSVFEDCFALTNITLPSHLASIGDYAFNSCSNLTAVTIPDAVTSIGDSAFASCPRLAGIKLGESVQQIGNRAFQGCTALETLIIPQSLQSLGTNALARCTSLLAIEVESGNPVYRSVDGVLFNAAGTTLVQYPGGRPGHYVIPANVTSIDNAAFNFCGLLTSVTLPAGLTNIGAQAFFQCTNLRGLFFQGNAPAIGTDAIDSGPSATAYYLPGTLGWSNSIGGIPAILWNPQPQVADPLFGVRSNRFGFNIAGTPGIPLAVQGALAPSGPWTVLQSCTLTNGLLYFSDPQWSAYPRRFYKITPP